MSGLLESLLRRRYGAPAVTERDGVLQLSWGDGVQAPSSVLYKASNGPVIAISHELQEVYGDCLGGSLLGGMLRVALVVGTTFGLYGLNELQRQPEVQRARTIDSEVEFFMDASNVWFYGAKAGMLYVYDSETGELDRLGVIGVELERLLAEWQGS